MLMNVVYSVKQLCSLWLTTVCDSKIFMEAGSKYLN